MRFITDEIAQEMQESIVNLMHHWRPNRDGSDYRCEFCTAEPPTDHEQIVHDDDCSGVKFMAALRRSVSANHTETYRHDED